MNNRQITLKEFQDNGGYKNHLQYTTGSHKTGNIRYWTVK